MQRSITLEVEIIHDGETETYSDVDVEDTVHAIIESANTMHLVPMNVSVTNVEELDD